MYTMHILYVHIYIYIEHGCLGVHSKKLANKYRKPVTRPQKAQPKAPGATPYAFLSGIPVMGHSLSTRKLREPGRTFRQVQSSLWPGTFSIYPIRTGGLAKTPTTCGPISSWFPDPNSLCRGHDHPKRVPIGSSNRNSHSDKTRCTPKG